MKKWICLVLAAVMAMGLLGCCAMAEEKVQLPDSRFFLTLPDGMEYDGPGPDPDDTAKFAYVSEALGLDIQFFSYEAKGAELQSIAKGLTERGVEAAIYRIAGQDMIVYRTEDETDGAKSIGYILKDGEYLLEVTFWYATQDAADLTEQIILSLTE